MAKTLQLRSDATITGADGKKWNVKGSLGLFAVLLLAIPLLVLGLGRSDSVNARTIARLQLGMTEREVERVLGRAPDCEAVVDRKVSCRVKKYRAKQWVGPVRTVRVAFNEAGKTFTIAEGWHDQALLTGSASGSGSSFSSFGFAPGQADSIR